MTNKKIGESLHLQRLSVNMTQERVAKIIKVRQSALCRIEKGTQNLTLKDAVKLEKHLGKNWFRPA